MTLTQVNSNSFYFWVNYPFKSKCIYSFILNGSFISL